MLNSLPEANVPMDQSKLAAQALAPPPVFPSFGRTRIESGVKTRPVLKAENISLSSNRVLLEGCSPHADQKLMHEPPTIILEKGPDDRIRKITVQCPCGRHAEVVCIYDQQQDDEEGHS